MQRVDVLERRHRTDLLTMRAVRISPYTNGQGTEGNEEGSNDIPGGNLRPIGNGLPGLSGAWETWPGLCDPGTFGFNDRWGTVQLEAAHRLMDYWRSNPVDLDLFARMYYSLEYCVKYRAITNYAQDVEANELRLEVAERCAQVFPTRWVPLAELAHIPTRTDPDRLASVQEGWETTRNIPIYLQHNGKVLGLVNGNHRLTTAREYGVDSIFAAIAPECPAWNEARDREEAVLVQMRDRDRPFPL